MSFRLFAFLAGLLLAGTASAQTNLAVLTAGGQTFTNVVVLGFNATDLYFSHAGGIANVRLRALEPALQAQFNYDEAAALRAEKQQAENDARYKEKVRGDLEAEVHRSTAAAVSTNAQSWAELALTDPLGEGSPVNQPAPPLNVEKWLGPKPETKGRLTLLVFWSVHSPASRAALPLLNGWQQTHRDKLLLVGVTSDTENEVAQAEQKPDFLTGSDPGGKLAAALSVRTLPCGVLIDPQGFVRFHGHPAALDDKKLQAVLTRAAE